MINNQPPEKKSKDIVGHEIEIVDLFPTIQGEGPFVGCPSVFIRTAGCNLRCPLCDTQYTQGRSFYDIETIIDRVKGYRKGGLVVITGGEPLRQPIGPLVKLLLIAGYKVQVETNGTLFQEDLPYGSFTIVCSPKAAVLNKNLVPHISVMKYVVQTGAIDDVDGLPTMVLGMPMRVARPVGLLKEDIYIQPADEGDKIKTRLNLHEAVGVCMKHGYRLCTQLHKEIGLP